MTIEQVESVIRLSISLYPEQHAVLMQLAKESGLENVSAALRLIINEWARMKGLPAASPAGAGDGGSRRG